MNQDIQQWVAGLGLEPHVEGGYYKQLYKAVTGEGQAQYTSILFLLLEDNPSHFHRLSVDEVWYYHAGQAVTVHEITPDGQYLQTHLGPDIQAGQVLQHCVPKGHIFGSTVETGYGLVGCMCSPGFEYEDFKLFQRADLLAAYPEHKDIITRLTRG
ncbi:cupin [Suicoccus acidiformans]|uniref:Cupin n=1 Tax=Suicoccus acidiformans TaxID=2036206 RepID=A0A347WI08_9LACT|nr:cupin domain-containing protein [Suicoccus acidiformans]AXY24715.1 cupin [Suicoccus acidiformans]